MTAAICLAPCCFSSRGTHACDLLAAGQEPVWRVYHESGFNNVSNFNRQFMRHLGRTPTAYRRMCAEQARAVAAC